mgnify:FL=1
MRKSLEKVFDIIGEILAVLALILYVFLAINAQFMFLPDGVLNVLMVIQQYSFIIVTIVVGFEAMIKRNLLFRIIFYVIVAAVVILQFFPGTWYRVDNQNARDKRNWVMVGENTVLPDALR